MRNNNYYIMRQLYCFLAGLFFALNLAAQEKTVSLSGEERAQEYFLQGQEYSQQGEYGKANEAFKKAEELLKKASLRRSEPEAAAKGVAASGVVKEKHNKLTAILKKASRLIKENRLREAMVMHVRALEITPQDPDIHYNLAVLYLKTANYYEAFQELRYVVRLNPNDADAHYNLGILYEIYLNDFGAAAKHYGAYLKLMPDAPDGLLVEDWIASVKKKK